MKYLRRGEYTKLWSPYQQCHNVYFIKRKYEWAYVITFQTYTLTGSICWNECKYAYLRRIMYCLLIVSFMSLVSTCSPSIVVKSHVNDLSTRDFAHVPVGYCTSHHWVFRCNYINRFTSISLSVPHILSDIEGKEPVVVSEAVRFCILYLTNIGTRFVKDKSTKTNRNEKWSRIVYLIVFHRLCDYIRPS